MSERNLVAQEEIRAAIEKVLRDNHDTLLALAKNEEDYEELVANHALLVNWAIVFEFDVSLEDDANESYMTSMTGPGTRKATGAGLFWWAL